MDLLLLNNSRSVIDTIDVFESAIWSDRYNESGDFELHLLAGSAFVSEILTGYYLSIAASEHLMVIEDLAVNSDAGTTGDKFVAKGKSIESLLNRRIIWNKTTLTGNFQVAIEKLLNENILDGLTIDPDRIVSGLVFEASTDPVITALTIDRTFYGENLYDAIKDLCLSKNIGFKIIVDEDFQFIFQLYSGVDRSYAQETNPFVVFSPDNDNLLKSDYKSNDTALKTVTLVAGGSEDTALVTTIVEATGGAGSDLSRREMFTNATSVQQIPVEGTLTEEEYLAQLTQNGEDYFDELKQIGAEDLAKNTVVESFESEIDTTSTLYVYNEDFFMGDIVQVQDAYGHDGRVQVTEVVHSEDGDGEKVYPTFTTIV